MKCINRIIALLGCVVMAPIQAVDIGSDTTVDRFNTQQVLQNGDRIAGFAALAGGFKLFGANVNGRFDSFFPAEGTIELESGTLALTKDLIFHNITEIKSLGSIDGNFHVMEFSPSITCIPQNNSSGDLLLDMIFVTSQPQPDDVETSDWSFNDKFIAIGLGEDESSHDVFRIYEFNGSSLTLRHSQGLGTYREITDINWHPSALFVAMGRLNVSGQAEIFIFSVNATTGVATQVSSAEVGADVYAIAWHPSGNFLAVGRNVSASEVAIYSVTGGGVISASPVATADINSNRTVQTQAIDWNAAGTALAVGVNTSGGNPELLVYAFNSGVPSLTLNATKVIGKPVRAVDWNLTYPTILAVGLEGTTGDLVEVYEHNSGAGSLTKKTGIGGLGAFVRNIDWSPNGELLLIGRNATTGGELRAYIYNPTLFTLTLFEQFEFADPVETVRWSKSGIFAMAGTDDHYVAIYKLLDGSDSCFIFSDLDWILNYDLVVKNCCILFQGDCLLNGQGSCLTIDPTCTLVIDRNSSVFFKDIIVRGINDGNRIGLIDTTSTMSFEQVTWILDGDYTMTTGKFDVIKDFHIIGDGRKFVYRSPAQSRILDFARMILDEGVTFSYSPLTTSRDLLKLVDETSQLVMSGATLHSTTTGLRLTKGVLVVDRESSITSDATVEAQAISFGDGVSVANNLCVQILPAAHLDIVSGSVVYNNV